MSHCRKCGDAGDDALFTVSLPAGVEEDRRLVAHWAADCAERVLALFEAKAPSDTRPREAIEGARAFALDGKRTDHLRSLGWAAHAAAREVGDPVATAAARAATYAAATPYTHALATPHQSKHVLGPAVYQAQARELAAGNDPSVGHEEIHWAIERVSSTVREVVGRMPVRSPLHYHLVLQPNSPARSLCSWQVSQTIGQPKRQHESAAGGAMVPGPLTS